MVSLVSFQLHPLRFFALALQSLSALADSWAQLLRELCLRS